MQLKRLNVPHNGEIVLAQNINGELAICKYQDGVFKILPLPDKGAKVTAWCRLPEVIE